MRRRTRRRPPRSLGIQGAAAGRALPRGAAVAMIAHRDAGAGELALGELANVQRFAPAMPERQAEHLVEVAVVDVAAPVDGDQRGTSPPLRSPDDEHRAAAACTG